MLQKVFCFILTTALLVSFTSCKQEIPEHEHKFNSATCTSPKTCSICGETQGDLGDHKFSEDHVCSVCGETTDHKYLANHRCDYCFTLEDPYEYLEKWLVENGKKADENTVAYSQTKNGATYSLMYNISSDRIVASQYAESNGSAFTYVIFLDDGSFCQEIDGITGVGKINLKTIALATPIEFTSYSGPDYVKNNVLELASYSTFLTLGWFREFMLGHGYSYLDLGINAF